MKNKYDHLQTSLDDLNADDANEVNIGQLPVYTAFSEDTLPPPQYSEASGFSDLETPDKANSAYDYSTPWWMKVPVCIGAFLLLSLPCLVLARFMNFSLHHWLFCALYCILLPLVLYVTYDKWIKIFREALVNIKNGLGTASLSIINGIKSALISILDGVKEAVVITARETKEAIGTQSV
ncbi:hypothetical protein SPOG_00980 [Schizosaccharomyces cryophilus OY26]|uniref:Uncharacterized protein n=1 Tax=Schizosaccharomyces cryophilus (strain OY26 / ATCC MYA-4695 / CBS 11777 / NBRC 106824 / NRRL Y48691) TaxID=653667 RepID=S9VVL7_SCHCR|nr:uncharacterized protein SPOG_00980 [Schizosaccharomyces cryophilus OY26]EPY50219.1 hypothetical protein SPOG_00980 [Schizosaccharomyces cryophilus OY26]